MHTMDYYCHNNPREIELNSKPQIIRKHFTERGEVALVQWPEHTDQYSVHVIEYHNYGTANKVRGKMDAQTACDFYPMAVRYVDGVAPWAEPRRNCGFAPDQIQKCSPENCPQCLGGAAFWEIFGAHCIHRTR